MQIKDNAVVTTSDTVPGCSQLNYDGTCKTPASGYYIYNGYSCQPGFYAG